MPELVKELWKYARDETTWLVDVPLSTLVPPRQAVPLGSRAILVKADPRRRRRHRFDAYQRTDPFAVRRHLGDDLTPRPRWLSGSQAWDVDIDTRTEASLLLVEDGIEEVAVSLAESKVRFVLAMWCLLSPPRLQYHPAQPWPTVARWAPAPFVEFGTQRKLYQPNRQFGERITTRRGAHITTHASYQLTRSEPFLRAPFDAIEEARKGNQCALALLSAARSLYLAECTPNELERTERVLHVWRAREALCDRGRRGQGSTDQRWNRLVITLRLRGELLRLGYVREEVAEAFELVEKLRHLSTHRAEDVLVSLNYPEQLQTQLKQEKLGADTLGLALVTADWPVLLMMVHLAIRRLTKGAIRNGWNEKWFHSQFEKQPRRR